MASQWYVVRTEFRSEERADSALDKDGIQHYFPTMSKLDESGRVTSSPLFPGYMFIKWDRESPLSLFSNPKYKIANWLRFGDEVPSIPDSVMDGLMNRLNQIDGMGDLKPKFRIGDEVTISSDIFQGIGRIAKEPGSAYGRALVLLEFMGRLVEVNVPCAQLEILHDDRAPGLTSNDMTGFRRTRGKGRRTKAYKALTAITS